MKRKEVFWSIVAFTLLLMTFSIVALTTSYTDNIADDPVSLLSSDSEKGETNRTFIHSSADNLERVTQECEGKSSVPAASNRRSNNQAGNPKTNARSSKYSVIHPDLKDRLTPIESNGRVYLENTTGIEPCEDDDEGKIETIE